MLTRAGTWNVPGSVFLVALAGSTGCFVPGTADPPPASPTPVAVVTVPAPASDPAGMCDATLTVTGMRRSSSSCYVDEVVTRTPGTLRYPCAGGDAEAQFGTSSRFVGSVRDGNADVKISTDFSFSDGCRWRSIQLIQGELRTGRLVFSYRESPIEGQSGCASPCTADAEVRVQ